MGRWLRHPLAQVMLVVLVAAFVYLPFLGVCPLDKSEGHRAVPGWTMLETGDYWHIKMFGLTYIRKPPGMPWAIAGSSAVFGQTPFAARLPSAVCAILMSVVAWWYGRRWFGAGLSAGLAQALMPLMWSPGRTAEIEMLNNFGTQLFALGLLDALMVSRRGAEAAEEDGGPLAFLGGLCASARDVLLPALGIFVAALAKGPASAMVLGGVVVGACIAARSARPLASTRFWIALLLGAAVTAIIGLKVLIANNDPNAVREDVAAAFLWSRERIVGVLTLMPVAFASALPASFALLIPFQKSRADAATEDASVHRLIARSLAWSWLVALGVLVLAGVSNARYAMPAAVLLPPLVPHAIGALRSRLVGKRGWPIERMLLLGAPRNWGILLMLGVWWYLVLSAVAPTPDQRAGPNAARTLADDIKWGTVWADDAIEARPDILWLIPEPVIRCRIEWAKHEMAAREYPQPGDHMILRTDRGSGEGPRYFPGPQQIDRLLAVRTVQVRNYELTLFKVLPEREK